VVVVRLELVVAVASTVSVVVPMVTVRLALVIATVDDNVALVFSIVPVFVGENSVLVAVEVVLEDVPNVVLSAVPSKGDTSLAVEELADKVMDVVSVSIVSVTAVMVVEVE
jgi:hypothetical protein